MMRRRSGMQIYVEPIALETLSDERSSSLLGRLKARHDETCAIEERGDLLALLHAEEQDSLEFVMGFRVPSRSQIETMAKEKFMGESVHLGAAWVVDSPLLFVVAWNGQRAYALPISGLGPGTWRSLDEHLELVRAAAFESAAVGAE